MVWDEPGPGGGQAKHTRRLPVETTLVQEAHSKACEVCECDRSCLGAGGWTWSRPGSRRSAPSPVARAVHGEIVHHAGGHTSSSQTPRTCSGCRARSCSHQGSAGLITCLVCWMRCSLPPICIWVPSLPPPPLFRPEASSSSPSRILLAWPQGRGGGKGGECWLRGGRFGAWASIQPIPEQFQIESPAEVWWQMQPLHPSSGFQTAAGGGWKRQRPLKACHFRKMGAAACSPVHGLTTIDRRPTRAASVWIGDRTARKGDSNLVEAVSLAFRSRGSRTTKSINNHTHRAAGGPGTEHKHPSVGVINPLSLGDGGVHGIGRLYRCFIAALPLVISRAATASPSRRTAVQPVG